MPSQTRSNAIRDLTISVIWVFVSVIFLNVDRHRIIDLRAAHQHISRMRWIQIPIWVAVLVFWVRNGRKAWRGICANESH